MIEEKYNNQTYPAEFFANIVNGARVDDTSVFKIENGALAQIWPIFVTVVPTAQDLSTQYFHIYCKTITNDTLEFYVGEYSRNEGGYVDFSLNLSFTNLNSNNSVTFDFSLELTDAIYETSIAVNNVVWWNYLSPTVVTEKKTISTYSTSFNFALQTRTYGIGRWPTRQGFVKVRLSNFKNGSSKKFVWLAPQTIYEVWPT